MDTLAPISPRLEAAIISETLQSGEWIDAGIPLSLRALVLGQAGDWRLPLIALPEAEPDEFCVMVQGYVYAAMMFTLARQFVLTLPDANTGRFITYGVEAGGDRGLSASLEPPFDQTTSRLVSWPDEVGTPLRSWIPPTPTVIAAEWQPLATAAFGPGCPYELQPIGPRLYPFGYVEGNA